MSKREHQTQFFLSSEYGYFSATPQHFCTRTWITCIIILIWIGLSESAARPAVPSGSGNVVHVPEDINLTEAVMDFKYGRNGPDKWYELYKACGGKVQSPINIDTTTSKRVHHPHLFWWNYNLRPREMTLTNNGHTVVLTAEWANNDQTPYYWHSTGYENYENYVLDHIHFHWGLKEEQGSEHRINNRGFPLEMHAVHYNKKLPGVTQALILNHGIRVISILFMVSDVPNHALDGLVNALPRVRHPSSIQIEPFEVGKLLNRFSKAFVTYNGSLTTPPCAEAVTWIIRLLPSTISLDQLEAFRKLQDYNGELIAGNVRPVQPLNGRTILHIT